MITFPSIPCSRSGCSRRTTHVTGACHDHRDGLPRMIGHGRLLDPAPDEVWCSVGLNYLGERVEEWSTGHTFGRAEGPWRTVYRHGGMVLEEWPLFREQTPRHRIGAPALIRRRANGEVVLDAWWFEGKPHRVDGPAITRYESDGSVADIEYWIEGVEWRTRSSFVSALGRKDPERLTELFELSSYAPLLAEGYSAREIVRVLGLDVRTAESVREVLAGAPVEWVRSFEDAEQPS